ncbi:hypothetical protein EDC96DRAFT_174918 [Choanephora cucurbitarum]|nr:hypothetical protein EDC96DRAFT_174918 [Choanephora cucurbitarum]
MDKWQGSFAQTQLEKFGWESGEGLGKNKEGNVKHISVSVKNDKKGVGVNAGQWEFAWWDHLYNKSASSVVVAKEEGEIKVGSKAKGETRRSKTGIISTEKPTGKTVKEEPVNSSLSSMADQRNMMDSVKDIHVNIAQRVASASLYGSFVKSTTTSAVETPTSSNSDNNDEDEDEDTKDYSMKISDAELFAACEGRTARKGGRGLVDQTGKFKRVMQDFVRPVDTDEVVTSSKKSKKRKHDESDKKETKKAKKAEKEARKAEKIAKKAEKIAKKAEKEARKAEKVAKKAEKELKKSGKKEKKSKN